MRKFVHAALAASITLSLGLAASPADARRGADDPAGHVRQGRGADDPAGHTRRG
ncbi:MAG: hypothetical protein JHD16_09705, partial [Solirubrobacteraceae bacterium]|nr:hypothetical protein [Solirubrobacteraceae bacterium]